MESPYGFVVKRECVSVHQINIVTVLVLFYQVYYKPLLYTVLILYTEY